MKPFAIPTDWTAQQALAVVDLLDELRCHIWAKYELSWHESCRELCGGGSAGDQDDVKPFVDDPIESRLLGLGNLTC